MEPAVPSISEGNSTCLRGALEVLGRHVEPTGAMESSRRNPQGCMEHSNTTEAVDPNGGSGLLNRCCQWHRIQRLGGLIGPVGPIEAVESNGISTGAAWRQHAPMRPMPECLSASSATAIVAVLQGPPQSSLMQLKALED